MYPPFTKVKSQMYPLSMSAGSFLEEICQFGWARYFVAGSMSRKVLLPQSIS